MAYRYSRLDRQRQIRSVMDRARDEDRMGVSTVEAVVAGMAEPRRETKP